MSVPIYVDSADDPRIAPYRAIRERDLVGREGLFIAEGEVVVRVLVTRSLHPPLSLLLAEKRLAALNDLLPSLPSDVPVYVASQTVIDTIAGFSLHRGILALGRRASAVGPARLLASLPARSVVVALFGIANHDNMGGIFRNAAAFGAGAVLIDSDCCDPLYRKAIRVSVGAALTVPFAKLQPGEDAIALLQMARFTPVALSPRGATLLEDLRPPEKVAVLLGAEGPGLPDDILERATTVRIDMAGAMDSLNVATASGIVLHRLTAWH